MWLAVKAMKPRTARMRGDHERGYLCGPLPAQHSHAMRRARPAVRAYPVHPASVGGPGALRPPVSHPIRPASGIARTPARCLPTVVTMVRLAWLPGLIPATVAAPNGAAGLARWEVAEVVLRLCGPALPVPDPESSSKSSASLAVPCLAAEPRSGGRRQSHDLVAGGRATIP